MEGDITGFGLFMVCHYFGRRGRAMVNSLARQLDCPVPFKITIFYSRSEDADLLLEGAGDSPSPGQVTLLQIPADRVMQRAMHFSLAHEMHEHSHTVFCDADLWFPPSFLAEYIRALSGEPPGYYSCRVMDIPWPRSEDCVDAWKDLRSEGLDLISTGRRYDGYRGHVGHFQCVPRGLAPYPADPRSGVDVSDLAFSKIAIERSINRRVERRIGRPSAYHLDHPQCWTGTGGLQL